MSDALEAARAAFLEGISLYEADRFGEAEARFEAALRLAPGRVSVLVNLAATRLRLERPEAALAALDVALAAEPHHADAWCHRGFAASALQRHEDALDAFARALSLDANLAPAAYHRAVELTRVRRHAEALAALDDLIRREPRHTQAWTLHGRTLRMLERHEQAVTSFRGAVAADPAHGAAWSHLGQLLADLGRGDEAADALERAIACSSDVDINRYFLAALGRAGAPAAAPPGYVRALFDGYADDFEAHLVDGLHYRAHEHVVQAALDALPGAAAVSSALDLGCGTGLCGDLLRGRAARLDGVDLSETMLAAAARRGVYDTLVQAELVEHLRTTPQRHALVVCADTFIYLGDLDAAFAGVRRVLDERGVFAFSVERLADEAGDVALTRHLRYAHAERHVRARAAANGLRVALARRVALREEQGRPVDGIVFACVGDAGP